MRFQRNSLVLAVLMGSSAAVFAAAPKKISQLTVKEIYALSPQKLTAEQIEQLREVAKRSGLEHRRQAAGKFIAKHTKTLAGKLKAQGKSEEAGDLHQLAAEFSRERSPYSSGPAAGQPAIGHEQPGEQPARGIGYEQPGEQPARGIGYEQPGEQPAAALEPDFESNDPRAVLGVLPTASANDIRAAYRRLIRIHHPDKGGRQEVFVKIQRAYDTLR